MTQSGPSLLSLHLWVKREARCLSILERALVLLRNSQEHSESENELNRRLYFWLLMASRELFPESDLAPVQECNNQPDPDDEARAKREHKRPDFQWVFLDRYELDPERSSKQFVVECKRLGNPPRAEWILNLNYANHGIKRFKDPEHAYAKRFASGAMVGYWQSMEAPQVLEEVNEEAHKSDLPDILLTGSWESSGVSHLEHTFERPFDISPFRLRHLWIDLRLPDKK
jgi:hypothetical protein